MLQAATQDEEPSAPAQRGHPQEAIELDPAAAVFRQWLEQDPGNPTATHHLAACPGQGVPERAAVDYVASTFDAFAASFEDQLQNRLSYRAPQQVVEALQRHLKSPAAQFDILDLGCGTGLCAHAIGYLIGYLAAAGFELLELECVVLRSEGGRLVAGIVAVWRR